MFENGNVDPMLFGRLKSAVPFWRNVLKAPKYVIDWIHNGVGFNFFKVPEKMMLPNNKSSVQNADYVTKTVLELETYGLVKRLKSPPKLINPLSVAFNSGGKPRLVLDMSAMNNHVLPHKFRWRIRRRGFSV